MTSIASHIFWRQAWNLTAEPTLTAALASFNLQARQLTSQNWNLQAGTIGEVAALECAFFAPAGEGWSVLQLPVGSPLGESLAAELSLRCNGAALLIREVGQTAWGYLLQDRGQAVDQFWSMPSMVDVSPALATGNPARLSETLGIPEAEIAVYLNHLSPDEVSGARAFPDDEFALGDPWVRVDFLRRLGLSYPRPFASRQGRFFQLAPLPPGPVEKSDPLLVKLGSSLHAPPPPQNPAEQSGRS